MEKNILRTQSSGRTLLVVKVAVVKCLKSERVRESEREQEWRNERKKEISDDLYVQDHAAKGAIDFCKTTNLYLRENVRVNIYFVMSYHWCNYCKYND